MLDIKYIIENKDEVQNSIKERHVACDLDGVIALYEAQNKIKTEVEALRAEANANAAAMKSAKDQTEREPLIKKGGELKAKIAELSADEEAAIAKFKDAMMTVPNTLAPDAPAGRDDTENEVISTFMGPTKFDFTPKDHVA